MNTCFWCREPCKGCAICRDPSNAKHFPNGPTCCDCPGFKQTERELDEERAAGKIPVVMQPNEALNCETHPE